MVKPAPLSKSEISASSLISALAENERIRSVRDSLSEGISGLRLYPETSLSSEVKSESKRCLKILHDFCHNFLVSVDFEKASSMNNREVMSKFEEEILSDLALYSGIVSTFSSDERKARYKDIEQIHELLRSTAEPKKLTKQEFEKYVDILENLYKIVESRTTREQEVTERIILGNNGTI